MNVDRLGWTLLHFLWEGMAIAVIYAVARRTLQSAGSNARYTLACAALAGMMVAPLVTWQVLGTPSAVPVAASPATPVGARSAPLPVPPQDHFATAPQGPIPEPFLSWVVAIWFAGTLVFWIRLAGGWAVAIRLRSALVCPAPPEWIATLERWKTRVGVGRAVRLLVSPVASSPMVIGWIRPVLLVPAAALAGLPAEQMEALLIHELAHIRRGDYFVNLLQSAAEALLFYHPAVWWISGHIREERELCCDDLAVSLTGDPVAYACALAEVASFRPARVQTAMAASGGHVARRIARLLGHKRIEPRRVAGPEVLAGLILAAAAAVLVAQPAARPKFEVASIKPSEEQRFMMVRTYPGRLTASAPLRLLIQNAYGTAGLQAFQIVGGPSWIDSDRWEIEAKAEANAGHKEVLQMLRTLLEDRFQLKAHHETREMPVYILAVAKRGPKLTTPKEGDCVEMRPDQPAPLRPGGMAFPCGRAGIMGRPDGARIMGKKIDMPEFVRVLAIVMGRTVIDQTGYRQPFDATLDFAGGPGTEGLPAPKDPMNPPPVSADTANPSIFTALQEQLGLKIDTGKGPVDVLVIDHVERPSVN